MQGQHNSILPIRHRLTMNVQAALCANLLALGSATAMAQNETLPKPRPKANSASAAASATAGNTRDSPLHSCTNAPRHEWIAEDEMKLLAEHRGYRIKTFKIAKGNCYEVYGFDKTGRIVEAYFNPVTTQLVRQNIAK